MAPTTFDKFDKKEFNIILALLGVRHLLGFFGKLLQKLLQNASAEELKLLSGFVGFSGLLDIVKANRKKISDRIENIKFRYYARQELGKDAEPELLVDRIVNTFEKENKTKGSTLTLFKNVFSSVYDQGEELLKILASVKKEQAELSLFQL